MDKKKLIGIIGGVVVGIVAIVCILVIMSPMDYDNKNNNNNSNSNNTNTDNSTTKKYEFIDEIDVKVDKILDTYSVTITGKVKNVSGKQVSYAQITYSVFDEANNLLGSTFDNVNNWDAGIIWSFSTFGMINGGVPHHVRMTEITGF